MWSRPPGQAGPRFVRAFHQPWPFKIEGDEEGDVEYALLRRESEQTTAEATGGLDTSA